MVFRADKYIPLPTHKSGGFDHADVYLENGWVYLAHPANGSVEVIDGVKGTHVKTIPGCPEASGVICAQKEGITFAASRGTGKLLVINAKKGTVNRTLQVGNKPNGLAWDSDDGMLLAADIGDLHVRLVDPERGVLKTIRLPGRPRWCCYSWWLGKFLIAIRDPPSMVTLHPRTGELSPIIPISASGPHGIDIDQSTNRAFIGCDAGALVVVDLESLKEKGKVSLPTNADVLWFNQEKNQLYCAVAKPGLIEIIDAMNMKKIQEIKTEEGAGTLTFDSKRQRLYSFHPKACRTVVYINQ